MMETRFPELPLGGIVSFKTGKLNSNAAKPDGEFPFFTCSQETYRTDTWSFDGEYVLLAGNNAAGIYPLKYFNGKFDAYQRTYAIRSIQEDKLFTRYVYFALRLKLELMKNMSTGVATKFLTLTLLNQTQIPVPPLATQRKIAAILSAYDDLIENNLRRIKILEAMAQNLYREWFVKFRFPGHQNTRFVDSPLGPIPEGWEVKTLGELAVQERRGVDPRSVAPDMPYVGLEHIPRKSFALREWGQAADVQSTKFLFREGEILFGKIRPYFHKVSVAPMAGICSSDTIVIRTLEPKYFGPVLCCVFSEEFVDHATQTSNGTKMPRANWDVLVEYPIVIPSESVLMSFTKQTREVITLAQNLVAKNANLRQTRDLLLPKLISGELDVSELDIEIPEELAESAVNPEEKDTPERVGPSRPSPASVPMAAEEPEAYGDADTEAPAAPVPVEDWDTNEVMAAFRQAARKMGQCDRDTLLKAVSQELGYARLGAKIKTVLKGHLKAAIRRHIIGTDGKSTVWPETRTMDSFERDELVDTFVSVMRKGARYDREDVCRAVANHLGFRRLTDTVRAPIKSAINGAIRRGVLRYEKDELWRVE